MTARTWRRCAAALLATSVLCALPIHPARALFGTGDIVFDPTNYEQMLLQVKSLADHLAVARAHFEQAEMTYRAFSGVRDLGTATYALSSLGIQNPLPVSPYDVQALIDGKGSAGTASRLASLFTNSLGSNAVYTSPGIDWRGQQLVANAASLAGISALSQQSYQAGSDRLIQLKALEARQSIASDPKDVADLHLAVARAQADVSSQQQQFQAVALQAQTQDRVRIQRDEEHERGCIDQLIAYFNRTSNSTACPTGNQASTMQTVAYNTGATASAYAAGGSGPLNVMMGQDWGSQAAANATSLGVNPNALAAACVVESNCQNVGGAGTVSGPFQMTNATYQADMRAAGLDPSLAGKSDPATESLAASQELKSQALALQQAGISNPTVLDTRGGYNFGAGNAVSLARADNGQLMSSVLSGYSPDVLRSNGIDPATTTVGAWRAGITSKLGPAASQPVLLGLTST